MPASKNKPTTSTSEGSMSEPSSALLEQEAFRQHLRHLAVSAVQVLLEQVMREELEQCLGASWGECTPTRRGYRNGSYTRDLVTPTGRIEKLQVPRDREGEFHSHVFERYNRYEPEVAEALTPMFVKGVSTHQVGEVAQTLMGVAPSASAVSRLNQTLTEQFEVWRERPLLSHYRIVYLDFCPLCRSSWRQNGFDDPANCTRGGSGRQQRGIGVTGVCPRKQGWVDGFAPRRANTRSHAGGFARDGRT